MDICWSPTNENGITSVRLVAISSLKFIYSIANFDGEQFATTAGTIGKSEIFLHILQMAESGCKGPRSS